jgi:hypothetical protein
VKQSRGGERVRCSAKGQKQGEGFPIRKGRRARYMEAQRVGCKRSTKKGEQGEHWGDETLSRGAGECELEEELVGQSEDGSVRCVSRRESRESDLRSSREA